MKTLLTLILAFMITGCSSAKIMNKCKKVENMPDTYVCDEP